MNTQLVINDSEINLTQAGGVNYIAIKPICQALGVNYDRQFKNIKEDSFFGQLYAKQHTTGSDGKTYEMICLPEKYIYGWLCSIQSDNQKLLDFKKVCYDLLYDYFNGAIGKRMAALKAKTYAQLEMERLEQKIASTDDAKRLAELKLQCSNARKTLTLLDNDVVVTQLGLWEEAEQAREVE